MKSIKSTLALLFLLLSSSFAQTEWAFDKSHSKIGFSITHMVISETEGSFSNFDGKVVSFGDSFENAILEFTVDINSINTDNEKRDNHLKSPDFFDSAKYPDMVFKSSSFKKVDDKNYKLLGQLTIKDVTKEIELDIVFNGIVDDPWGNTRAGFKLKGELNRFDYGLTWNNLLEMGGLVVGETVTISSNIELIKQSKVNSN